MRNILNAASAMVLVVGLTVSGIASGAHHGEKSGAAEVQGVHEMSGTITQIDHASGMLGLKTGAGDLTLHFPPPTIENLKEGDKITVHLGYTQ